MPPSDLTVDHKVNVVWKISHLNSLRLIRQVRDLFNTLCMLEFFLEDVFFYHILGLLCDSSESDHVDLDSLSSHFSWACLVSFRDIRWESFNWMKQSQHEMSFIGINESMLPTTRFQHNSSVLADINHT